MTAGHQTPEQASNAHSVIWLRRAHSLFFGAEARVDRVSIDPGDVARRVRDELQAG